MNCAIKLLWKKCRSSFKLKESLGFSTTEVWKLSFDPNTFALYRWCGLKCGTASQSSFKLCKVPQCSSAKQQQQKQPGSDLTSSRYTNKLGHSAVMGKMKQL